MGEPSSLEERLMSLAKNHVINFENVSLHLDSPPPSIKLGKKRYTNRQPFGSEDEYERFAKILFLSGDPGKPVQRTRTSLEEYIEKDIELIVSQVGNIPRERILEAYNKNHRDIVNTIIKLS